MIKKILQIKSFGKFKQPSFGGDFWNGSLEQTNVIYANNGSGKTTLSLLFRSLKGNNEIVIKKKSFDSAESPEIILLDDSNKQVKYSKGKWNRFETNIEIFDSFYSDDNVYIITLKDDLKTPNIFELLLGEESISIKKQIDDLSPQIKKLRSRRTLLRSKRNQAITDEDKNNYQAQIEKMELIRN